MFIYTLVNMYCVEELLLKAMHYNIVLLPKM